VKRSARATGVRTEGRCLSMRYLITLLSTDLCQTTWWHQHGEVQAVTPAESNGSDDEDRMDDMIADIGMEYDLGSRDQHPLSKV
jgi:hypothetical protein